MSDPSRFDHYTPEWCPGCGNFDLLECLKEALCDLKMTAQDFIMTVGIGQASKLGFSVKCNMFDGLHGRVLPAVLGMSMANHKAKMIAVSGDGCFYAEGGNHFIHNARRNLNVTVLAGDNRVYGLTKGQASPTSEYDFVTKVHPEGVGAAPFNPILLALSSGATFVARGFTGNKSELKHLIKEAIRHQGFALLNILSPCVSFNKVNTFVWFKQRARPIDQGHDTRDLRAAMDLASMGEDTLPTGIFYQVSRPVFGAHLTALRGDPIVTRTRGFTPERVRPLFKRYR